MSRRPRRHARLFEAPPVALAASADASLIAATDGRTAVLLDSLLRPVWRSAQGQSASTVSGLWLTPQGDLLLLCRDGSVEAIDTAAGRPAVPGPEQHRRITGGSRPISSGTLSPDGRLYAAARESGRLHVIDLWDASATVVDVPGAPSSPGWRPDGSLWFTVGTSLWSWEPVVGEPGVRALRLLESTATAGIAWSPDGRRLAVFGETGPGTLLAADEAGIRALTPLPPGPGVFEPGGLLLIAASFGLCAFDPTTGAPATVADRAGGYSASPARLVCAAAQGGLVLAYADGVIEVDDHGSAPRQAADVLRWAAAMSRSVGRDGARQAPVRTVPGSSTLLCGPGTGSANPPFAWAPDGMRSFLETAPGVLSSVDADGRARWSGPARKPGPADLLVDSNGRHLAVVAPDQIGAVVTLRAADGGEPAGLAGGLGAAMSPDGEFLALPAQRRNPSPAAVGTHLLAAPWDAPGSPLSADGDVGRSAFSPDGQLLAVAGRPTIVWNVASGPPRRVARLVAADEEAAPAYSRVAFSPDGAFLAATPTNGGPVAVWAVGGRWPLVRRIGRAGGFPLAPALAWSPDGRILAFPGPGLRSTAVELWDAWHDELLARLAPPARDAAHVWTVAWAARTGRLATTYPPGYVVVWDFGSGPQPALAFADQARTISAQVVGGGAAQPGRRRITTADIVPHDILALLASAAARSAVTSPLAMLARLYRLLAPSPQSDEPYRPDEASADARLAELQPVTAIRELAWPAEALVGLAVLVASALESGPAYLAPGTADPEELTTAVRDALRGRPVAEEPATAEPAAIAAAFCALDAGMLRLLRLIGPDAVAADPSLPTRLHGLHLPLLPLSEHDGRFAGARTPWSTRAGGVEGRSGNDGLAGLAHSGPARALLPSQLLLDEDTFAHRAARGELLYRAWASAVPARARPTVLLLDDTAAADGEVGRCIRLLAHVLAVSLLDAGRFAELVTLAAPHRRRSLDSARTLDAIWQPCSVQRADVTGALRLAEIAAGRWSDSIGPAARVVVLTHAWRQVPATTPGGLRTDVVRVRHPGIAPSPGSDEELTLPSRADAAALRRMILRLAGPV